MNSFYCYIHFPFSGQWMDCRCRVRLVYNSITACFWVGTPELYIARILGLLYFLLFVKVQQLKQNAIKIHTNK